jgi:hypothetical protein
LTERPSTAGPGWQATGRKVVIVGVLCGLAAALLVRFAVVVLLGGVKVLAILGVIGLVWLLARAVRPRRR